MRIVARRTLREFVSSLEGHKDQHAVGAALDAWYREVSRETWRSAAELKATYRNASVVTAQRVVFNIKGNDYRMVVAIDYEKSGVWIKWIGPHEDYDKIDAAGVDYERD